MNRVLLSQVEMKDTVWESLPAFLLETPENAEGLLKTARFDAEGAQRS